MVASLLERQAGAPTWWCPASNWKLYRHCQTASRLLKLGQAEEAASLALTVQLPNRCPGLATARSCGRRDAGLRVLEQARNLDPRNTGILFTPSSLTQPTSRAVELIREGDLGNGYILLGKLNPHSQPSTRPPSCAAISGTDNQLVLYEQHRKPSSRRTMLGLTRTVNTKSRNEESLDSPSALAEAPNFNSYQNALGQPPAAGHERPAGERPEER